MMIAERVFLRSMDEEKLWRAVLSRDAGFDGQLFYGVRSTGVFCRPSCPSRRPNRDQVVFFTDPSEAEQAGFRPCLRCRPVGSDIPESQTEAVRLACDYIDSGLEEGERLTLQALGECVGFSPHHLQRTFKRVMGVSPRQYAESRRVERLKQQLKEGETVTSALYGAGYGSSSRLYEAAPSHLGMTPTEYRRGGKGMRVTYALADSPLGRLLVAATEKGICMVSLGDSDAGLESALRKEYPAADLAGGDSGLGEWVQAIVRYLRGQQPSLDLPLDVQATAFQRRVWEALQAIPYGATRSYSQVARAIGQPNATRAVAHACATNQAALVIPCHRVIREDGSLGGYRWGTGRKQMLLSIERSSQDSFGDAKGGDASLAG